MNCRHARSLFGAFWDDEITQAEREWLEAHFAGCEPCRTAYESFSRPLEVMASLPRTEAESGFPERVLARVRHVASAPDRLPQRPNVWVPATAAAALLLVAGTFVAPWLGLRAPLPGGEPVAVVRPPASVDVRMAGDTPPEAVAVHQAPSAPATTVARTDSLFDHSADVEFILDPVTLRRGQASLSRQGPGTQGERAVVSF